jgi:hypothetical protein
VRKKKNVVSVDASSFSNMILSTADSLGFLWWEVPGSNSGKSSQVPMHYEWMSARYDKGTVVHGQNVLGQNISGQKISAQNVSMTKHIGDKTYRWQNISATKRVGWFKKITNKF